MALEHLQDAIPDELLASLEEMLAREASPTVDMDYAAVSTRTKMRVYEITRLVKMTNGSYSELGSVFNQESRENTDPDIRTLAISIIDRIAAVQKKKA